MTGSYTDWRDPSHPLHYALVLKDHETRLLSLPGIRAEPVNQDFDTVANAINNNGVVAGAVHTRTSSLQAAWRPGATAYATCRSPAGDAPRRRPGFYSVTLVAGQTLSAQNFAYTRNVLISGSVFSDANGNHVRDQSEAGLSGWRVFIDKDNDGIFDTGENSVLSDAAGNWRFRLLPAGTYSVRVVRPNGWTQTNPPTPGTLPLALASGATSANNAFAFRTT